MEVLHNEPHPIIHIPEFVTDEECDHLISLAQSDLQRASTMGGISDVRTATHCQFKREWDDDKIMNEVRYRIRDTICWDMEIMETPEIINYQVGQKYSPHYDFFVKPDKRAIKRRNRVGTFIIYLNDVEEGGATLFTERKVKVFPKKRSGLFFSYIPSPASLTMHGGMPVKKGEKWILTNWIIQEFT